MDIKLVLAYEYKEEVKELFTEYTDMLIKGDSSFQEYLTILYFSNEKWTILYQYYNWNLDQLVT